MIVCMYTHVTYKTLYRIAENIGEFGELIANRQSFLPHIYGIFNIRILLVGHSPKFSPPNNLNS